MILYLCLSLACVVFQLWGLTLTIKGSRLSKAIEDGNYAEIARLMGRRR